jgi:GNAT superfamily N-acetyltransferase
MREATIHDLENIGKLLWKGRAECFPYQAKKMNFERGVDYMADLILQPYGLVLVEDDGEQIVAILAAMLEEPWFADDKIAKVLLLYVDEDYRSKKYGMAMMKRYITWAESHNALHILAGISSGVRTEAVTRMYQWIGFEEVGVTMMKKKVN